MPIIRTIVLVIYRRPASPVALAGIPTAFSRIFRFHHAIALFRAPANRYDAGRYSHCAEKQHAKVFVKIRSRWLNWCLAAAVVLACRILFRTLRIHYCVGVPNTNPYDRTCTEGFIYCVWHDAIAYPMFAGRHHRTVALVSKNFDGAHLARGLKMLGIGLVRGSSSRNGAAAIRELLRLPANAHVVLTPDGPRGPRRKTKPGMVFIAAHSGRSIVPTAFSAKRSWKIRGGWTSLSIPKPFTTVYALSGRPIPVSCHSTAQELAIIETQVQAEMDRLSQQAEQLATDGHSHSIGSIDEKIATQPNEADYEWRT